MGYSHCWYVSRRYTVKPVLTIAAGGGAYYFAKRSVNADRAARHEEDMKRRRLKADLEAEYNSRPVPHKQDHRKADDHAGSPSAEASHDPAPANGGPDNGGRNGGVVDKYLANKPYRSTKGDRFS